MIILISVLYIEDELDYWLSSSLQVTTPLLSDTTDEAVTAGDKDQASVKNIMIIEFVIYILSVKRKTERKSIKLTEYSQFPTVLQCASVQPGIFGATH